MERLLRRLRKRFGGIFKRPESKQESPLSTDHPAAPAPKERQQDPIKTAWTCPQPQADAPLERLPPEVRRQLLANLRLPDLRTLVRASPVFHQQYLMDRRFVLCKSLDTTLQRVAIDAFAAYQSSQAAFHASRTNQSVSDFLDQYHERRSQGRCSIYDEHPTETQVVDMVTFYFSFVKANIENYLCWTSANLAKCHESGPPLHSDALSASEEARIFRAFYRFELCCNVFGIGNHARIFLSPFTPQSLDIVNLFLCHFEPWQVEEINCVYRYARETHDRIFNDIAWDVDENNPKFDGQRPPTPTGAFDLGNSWNRDRFLSAIISRGLKFLYTVTFKIKNHDHLVKIMQENIDYPVGDFLGSFEALGETVQEDRQLHIPSVREEKQQRRDPLPFRGDTPLDDINELHPPLAWTIIWQDTYSNLFGEWIPEKYRLWGYVMWDSTRLESTGAKDVLLRQRGEEDWDPRDHMF
ncbi:hypothetical protein HIM_05109 [Hirsutella minnesotensis 3608]|uniref:F-box domain-containing protein n=1 Tax=Hirsutella minnesotensis 3608 TaxID=1043627 RepID=A0A0F7ZUT3_9HYPO|nr:hypothetical protein HIM_05109 [Hirsutella minnesotensis 3608]